MNLVIVIVKIGLMAGQLASTTSVLPLPPGTPMDKCQAAVGEIVKGLASDTVNVLGACAVVPGEVSS